MHNWRSISVVEAADDDLRRLKGSYFPNARAQFFDERFETIGDPGGALRYLGGEGQYANRTKFPFPDLILLDHKMPGDGWEIIEWVRQRPELRSLPVVVFSGSDDPNHQKKALALANILGSIESLSKEPIMGMMPI